MLYDDYLGTGDGLSELGVVYDETYGLDEYELLAALYDEDRAEGNMPAGRRAAGRGRRVCAAEPDALRPAAGAVVAGKRISSGSNCETGEAGALIRIEELLSGDAAKFIDWALADPDAAQPEEGGNCPMRS